jgi:hypothetical protein
MSMYYEINNDNLILQKNSRPLILSYPFHANPTVFPLICQAWIEKVNESGVSATYNPHYSKESFVCSYHFHLSFRNNVFGLLLSFWWEIKPQADNQTIEVYLMAGQDLEHEDQIELDRSDIEYLNRNLNDILSSVHAKTSAEPKTAWILYFIEGPMQNTQTTDKDTHRILHTRRLSNNKLLTPVALSFTSVLPEQIHVGTIDMLMEIIIILEVLLENTLKLETPILVNANSKGSLIYDTCPDDAMVSNLIPDSTLVPCCNGIPIDISKWAPAIIDIVESECLRRPENRTIMNALNAFHDGLHSESNAPMLAGIAFFATLASFTQKETCDGTVLCTKCGKRDPHEKTGEVNRVISKLEKAFGDIEWSKEVYRKNLKLFHTHYRSAFVHSAVTRFNTINPAKLDQPLWPTENSLIHPHTLGLESLINVRNLARLLVVNKLVEWDKRFLELYDTMKTNYNKPSYFHLGFTKTIGANKAIRLTMPTPIKYQAK